MRRVSEVEVIAIVGVGEDACHLACAAARAGCAVRLHDPDMHGLRRAQGLIREVIASAFASERIGADDRQRALDGILPTTDIHEALTHADLVVELTAQPPERRRSILLKLGLSCRASAVLATSEGAIDDLMDWVPQPGRLVGLRLPDGEGAPLSIFAGVETSAHALDLVQRFARRLGREAVVRGAERLEERP
jgi:3-hydroxyacyl-CoA dehydrogenase